MRFSFRLKLLTIVATTAAAFVILIIAETVLTRSSAHHLGDIQNHYVPVMEIGPRLENDFEHLRRGFQDSVASQDREAIKKTPELKAKLAQDLDAARSVIGTAQTSRLQDAIEAYCSSAVDVSKRLIAGESGTALPGAIAHMQSKQAEVERLIKESTSLDRGALVQAFETIVRAQKASGGLLLSISIACMVTVLILSAWLARLLFGSFTELSDGFARFGRGDFTKPIRIESADEFGALANEANVMALRINALMKELDSFSYSVAHDLRAPLRAVAGFSTVLLEDHGPSLPQDAKDLLVKVVDAAKRMGVLIDSLLNMSRLARTEMKKETVDLSKLVREIIEDLRSAYPDRKVEISIEDGVRVTGDVQLLRIVLTNLLGNAWKFTAKKPDARIDFGTERDEVGAIYFIRDNGAGFDMQYAAKLFGTFQRLHSQREFEGTGVGLATVQSIIRRHGGDIWAEARPEKGATFRFKLWRHAVATSAARNPS